MNTYHFLLYIAYFVVGAAHIYLAVGYSKMSSKYKYHVYAQAIFGVIFMTLSVIGFIYT